MDYVGTVIDQKKRALEANIKLSKLDPFGTWSNASLKDVKNNVMFIKPSGLDCSLLRPQDMVVVDIKSGKVLGGSAHLNPSIDTDIHLSIYRNFPSVGGIAHTHSKWATIFAQAGKEIPVLGTSHADSFHTKIPCTGLLRKTEIQRDYERSIGEAICSTVPRTLDCLDTPAALVFGHGPFTWGSSVEEAVENSFNLEMIAEMAFMTLVLTPEIKPLDEYLVEKHFLRKHGPNPEYGQQ